MGLSLRTWPYDTGAPEGVVSALPLSRLCAHIAGELHAIAEAHLSLASDNALDREREDQRSGLDEPSEDLYFVAQAGSGSQSNPLINPPQDGALAVSLLCSEPQASSDNHTKDTKRKTSKTIALNQLSFLEEAS
jgi:hypothetical protein